MTTKLKSVETAEDEIHMTSYFGGENRGRMLQLTPHNPFRKPYFELTKDDALALADALHEWVDGKREEYE